MISTIRTNFLFSGIALSFIGLALVPAHAQVNNAGKAQVAPSVIELQQRYPAGTINSEETASKALADVKKERANIEKRTKQEKRECAKVFLVTECRDQADERRRADRAELKQIENEAARYKRQQKVIKRDQALAEKRDKEEADAGKRSKEQEKFEKKGADRAARGGIGPGLSGKAPLTAEERAENVKAYDKKIEEYESNQEKVKQRKIKNDKKRAKKKAAEAKEAERAAKAAAQRAAQQ